MERRPILLVTNDLGPRAGGIETFILGLLGEIDSSRVVIYTSSQAGSESFDRALNEKTGAIIIRDRSKVLLPTPRVNRAVARAMNEYGSEVIWFGAAMPLGWMSGYLKRHGAKKIIALTHGHEVWWAKVPLFKSILRQSSKHIDVMTYLGEFTHNAIKRSVAASCQMVQLAPGISIDHFTPGPKDPDLVKQFDLAGHRVIICVGRLVHRKGQDKLIKAMPGVLAKYPDVLLMLVGVGPRKQKLDRLISKLGIEANIRFAGRVQYSELPKYFRLGDIFAMPSRSRLFGLEVEGLGIVYLEAAASGIAVLGGQSGGAPDAVLVGKSGEVVDGHRVVAISETLIEMLDRPERLHEMGRAGRQWAQEHWSWSIWGKRFNELLTL